MHKPEPLLLLPAPQPAGATNTATELPLSECAVIAAAESPLAPPVRSVCLPGLPIASSMPQHAGAVHICRLNGQWLSREHWHWAMEPGDVIEWYEVAGNRNTLRSVLQIAIAVASIYYPPLFFAAGSWQAAAAAVAITVVGNLAINALLPLQQQGQQSGDQPSPTYNTSLAGNAARLYQPIPKLCGTHLFYPPFAGQPYFEFSDNDQYYRAVFCVGIGEHDIVRQMIDDTDVNRFSDVLVARYLPPGVAPLDVLPNVVTAPEVSGAEMLSGVYIGGYAASGPRSTASHIGVDVIAPRGLSNLAVSWRVEYRPIDDFGAALSSWTLLATESRTANTNTAQRWSNKYALPAVARCEVRVLRTDAKNTDPAVAHEIQWAGLRAYLSNAAPLNPHAAHYELVMRASEQLSGLAQRRFALVATGKARIWSKSGGWTSPVSTRNPFWWLADLWTSTTWGEGLPDDRIDLMTIYRLALQADQRQDRFDYVFDTTMDAWEAAQLIARAGRARVFRRAGAIRSVARDELDTLPVTALTARNCAPGSMSLTETMRTRESPDGVILEYFDNRAWDWREILEPLPGVSEVTKPVIIRLPGVTGLTHARREAKYEAAAMAYRTRSVAAVTEMEGMLPAYLQTVQWQPDFADFGGTGDVVHASGATLELSEPVPAGATTITLIRDDGSLWGPTAFTLADPYTVTCTTAPDFTPSTTGATRERTKYLVGAPSSAPRAAELVRIAAISDGGKRDDVQYWRIDATIDNPLVHSADVSLLPAPGQTQDPVDDGSNPGTGGGGTIYIVDIRNAEYATQTVFGASHSITMTFRNDGRLVIARDGAEQAVTGQWLPAAPVAPTVADDFELYVSLADDQRGTATLFATLDTWQNLGTSRSYSLSTIAPILAYVILHVEIRSGGVVQDTADIRLTLDIYSGGGGGGGGEGPGD